MDLSPAKTQAWSKAAACPASLEPYWREFGLTLVGVPLGDPLPDRGLPDGSDGRRVDLGTDHYAQERCEEVAARATAFLDKLGRHRQAHRPAPHHASNSCEQRREELRRRTAGNLREARRPGPAHGEPEGRLPLRLRGRGLRSQEALAPAAWLGSWAQCLPEVLLRTGVDSLADLETSPLPLAGALRGALASLPAPPPGEREEDAEPVSRRQLALEPQKKLQRAFSRRLDGKHHTSLLNTLDAADLGRDGPPDLPLPTPRR